MENMISLYLKWHFIDRPKAILDGWLNCLKFNLNYWSVPILLKTYFSHWRKYRYSYGRGFDFGRFFEAFFFNLISRVLGALMRSFFIAIGLAAEVGIFVIGLFVFLFWLVIPVLVILGFIYGFKIIF